MSMIQDAFARGAFGKWLEKTNPGICEEGNLIVWKGYAYGDPLIYEWYRVAIIRYTDCTDIEVDCRNESMKGWMQRHKSYIKGKLIWYCRAVWQLMDEGLLNACDFDKTEEQVFSEDEDDGLEPWEREEKERDWWEEYNAECNADAQEYKFLMRRGDDD